MNVYAKPFEPTHQGDGINTQLDTSFAAAQYQHSGAADRHDLDVTNVTQSPQGDARCTSQRLGQEEAIQRLCQLSLSPIGSSSQHLPPPGLSWPEGNLGLHHDWSLSSSSASDASSGSTTRASTHHHGYNLIFGPSAWPSSPNWDMNTPVINGHAATSVSQRVIAPETGFSPGGHVAPSIASIQARPSGLDLGSGLGFEQGSGSKHDQQLMMLQASRPFQQNIPFQGPYQRSFAVSNIRTSLGTQVPAQTATEATFAMATPFNTMPSAALLTHLATTPEGSGFCVQRDFSPQMADRNGLQHRHAGSVEQSCVHQSSRFAHPTQAHPTHELSSGYSGCAERPRGPSPLNKKEEKYKSELCRNWEEKGFCYYRSRCQFAHGEHELRKVDRHPQWKSRLCKRYQLTGSCRFAKRCCFIHDPNSEPEQVASINRARRSSLLQRVGIVPSPSSS